MSDLVREARRNAKNWADKPDSAAMWNRFADHIEQLECHLAISKGKHTNAIARIEQLEAVIAGLQEVYFE